MNHNLGKIDKEYFKNIFLNNIIKKIEIEKVIRINNEIKKDIFLNGYKLSIIPYINNSEKYKITNKISSGSYGNVYDTTNPNVIFKKIKDPIHNKGKEFKSLIFHYLLLEEYKKSIKKKYLCELIEFGSIDSYNLLYNYYYVFMEKFGKSLFKSLSNYKSSNNSLQFNNLFKIFYQCCDSVSLIHDLKYLHLDIKLENFLVDNNKIKIIDFGMVNKNEFKTKKWFGTIHYIPNDWLDNYEKKKITKLTYNHDIFSLGCIFIELLYKFILDKKILMACPLILENPNINNFFTYIEKSNTWGENKKFINFFKKKYYNNNKKFRNNLFRELKEDYIYYKRIDFIENTEDIIIVENNNEEQKIATKIIYKEYNEMISTIETDLKTHFEKNISTIKNDLKKEEKKIITGSKKKISSLQKKIDDINTNINTNIKFSIFLIKRMCYPDPEIRCNNIHEIINHINIFFNKNAAIKLNYNINI